ncbi:MAG: DUF5684 domain-containing protein [Bacteroidota bacterium]
MNASPEFPIALFIVVGVLTLLTASFWRLFEKAGLPGWHALIPGYNFYQYTQIAGVSGWWTLGFFVPFFDIVARVFVGTEVAKRFGKDSSFGLGLAFLSPIFLPILAFGDSVYEGSTSETDSRTFVNEEGVIIEKIPLEDWD